MTDEHIERTVRRYTDSLYRLAYTQLRSSADAEDIVQETFLTYLRHAPQFESDDHERAWLMRVTVNRCRSLLRSPRWWHRADPTDEALTDLPATTDAEARELLEAVLALPPKYRTPIHLYYYEGYAIREIADILRIPAATVGTRLARARKLLYTVLTDEMEENHEKA